MTRILPQTRTTARTLRATLTPQQRRLWAKLREINRMLGTNFRRQAPVGRFVADFADYGRRLVIEVDGGQHAEASGLRHDAARDAWLCAQGFAVIRVRNSDVGRNLDGVMQIILDAVETADSRGAPPPPPSPTRGEGGTGRFPPAQRQGEGGPLPPCGGGMGWGGIVNSTGNGTP